MNHSILLGAVVTLVVLSGCTSPGLGASASVSAGPSDTGAGAAVSVAPSSTSASSSPSSTSVAPIGPRADIVVFNNTSPLPAYGSAHGNHFTFTAAPARLNLTLYINENLSGGGVTDSETSCKTPGNGGYTFTSPSGRSYHQEVFVMVGGKFEYSTTVAFEAGSWSVEDLWCRQGSADYSHTITVTATDGSIPTQGTWTSS